MQNFGRGMWRRLNDYDVINQIKRQNIQTQEYLAYKEIQMKLNRQQQINAYREKILQEKRRERELDQLNKQNFEPKVDEDSVYFEIPIIEYDIPIEFSLEAPYEEVQVIEQNKEEINDDKILVKEVLEEPKIVPKKWKKKNKKKK